MWCIKQRKMSGKAWAAVPSRGVFSAMWHSKKGTWCSGQWNMFMPSLSAMLCKSWHLCRNPQTGTWGTVSLSTTAKPLPYDQVFVCLLISSNRWLCNHLELPEPSYLTSLLHLSTFSFVLEPGWATYWNQHNPGLNTANCFGNDIANDE